MYNNFCSCFRVIFLFHENTNSTLKAKVCPPRLGGQKVGVFASRSPHRPSAVGVTLAHLYRIHGNKLLVSGIDILDGTPVLDIKPYIPIYDSVTELSPAIAQEAGTIDGVNSKLQTTPCLADLAVNPMVTNIVPALIPCFGDGNSECVNKAGDQDSKSLSQNVKIASWIQQPPISPLSVTFSAIALKNLEKFHTKNEEIKSGDERYKLEFFTSATEVKDAIRRILEEDPRSNHRRNNCTNEIYHLTVDNVNVSCMFHGRSVEVISVEPI